MLECFLKFRMNSEQMATLPFLWIRTVFGRNQIGFRVAGPSFHVSFLVRSVNTPCLNHSGYLFKMPRFWVEGWTYWIRTWQGQEFAFLINSQSVSYAHSSFKTQIALYKHSLLTLIICAAILGPSFFILKVLFFKSLEKKRSTSLWGQLSVEKNWEMVEW